MNTDAFERFPPQEIISRFGNAVYDRVDFSLNNAQPELHKQIASFYIASNLSSLHDKRAEIGKKFFKEIYRDKLTSTGEQTLIDLRPFRLISKVTEPRATFDKEAFINALSEKYDWSIVELRAVAATCMRHSAAPTSFRVELGAIDAIEAEF